MKAKVTKESKPFNKERVMTPQQMDNLVGSLDRAQEVIGAIKSALAVETQLMGRAIDWKSLTTYWLGVHERVREAMVAIEKQNQPS